MIVTSILSPILPSEENLSLMIDSLKGFNHKVSETPARKKGIELLHKAARNLITLNGELNTNNFYVINIGLPRVESSILIERNLVDEATVQKIAEVDKHMQLSAQTPAENWLKFSFVPKESMKKLPVAVLQQLDPSQPIYAIEKHARDAFIGDEMAEERHEAEPLRQTVFMDIIGHYVIGRSRKNYGFEGPEHELFFLGEKAHDPHGYMYVKIDHAIGKWMRMDKKTHPELTVLEEIDFPGIQQVMHPHYKATDQQVAIFLALVQEGNRKAQQMRQAPTA